MTNSIVFMLIIVITVVPPSLSFHDSQWMPETTNKYQALYILCFFLYTQAHDKVQFVN